MVSFLFIAHLSMALSEKESSLLELSQMGAGMSGATSYFKCSSSQSDLEVSRELLREVKERANHGTASISLRLLKKKIQDCSVKVSSITGTQLEIERLEIRNDKMHLARIEKEIREEFGVSNVSNKIETAIALKKKLFQSPDLTALSELKKQSAVSMEFEKKSCLRVDHRSKMGPIRNQQELGWCYSYALAEVLSFKTGLEISAVEMAITQNRLSPTKNRFLNKVIFKERESDVSGGQPNWLFEFAKKEGVCLKKNVDESDGNPVRLKTRLDQLELQKQKGNCSRSNIANALKDVFPSIDIGRALDVYSKANYLNYMTKLFEVACEPRQRLPESLIMETKSYRPIDSFADKIKIFSDIENGLSTLGPIVVAVDSKIVGVDRGTHAMTIAARQWNEDKKQCEYILRNSWGKDSCIENEYTEPCNGNDTVISKSELVKKLSAHYIVK